VGDEHDSGPFGALGALDVMRYSVLWQWRAGRGRVVGGSNGSPRLPKGEALERGMARALTATTISTGR
jgi:hypothetical protein